MDIILVPTEQGGLGKAKGAGKGPEEIMKLIKKPSKIINIVSSNLEETNNNIYNEVFVRVLIEERIIQPDKLILAGIRQSDQIEREFLNKNRIRYFTMQKIA